MTPAELAARLDGRKYHEEITREEEAEAAAAGLVVVFGASDDLLEFHGAIDDEVGVYEGGIALIDADGVLCEVEELIRHGDVEELRDYFRREPHVRAVEAVWETGDYSWLIKTDIPHAEFDVLLDDEKYCRGIVFAVADLAP